VGSNTGYSTCNMSRSAVSLLQSSSEILRYSDKLYRQAAIVRGAAIRGLGDIKPMSRRSRRHYGFQLDLRYVPDLDDEGNRYTNLFDRSERTRGTIVWSIKMVRYFYAFMKGVVTNQTKGPSYR
jgi:hypothetical protein